LATLNGIALLNERSVLVAFDNDPAGQRAAAAAYELLRAAGITTARVPTLPDGQDPAEVLATDGVDALVAALGRRRPLADVAVDAVLTMAGTGDEWTPQARISTLDAAARLIGQMPSEQRARQALRTARALELDAFQVLDTIQSHTPYDPTPQGPLGLPKPPPSVSRRQTLAAIAAKITAIGTDADDTAPLEPRRPEDRTARRDTDRRRDQRRGRDR
jgi:DNA primase